MLDHLVAEHAPRERALLPQQQRLRHAARHPLRRGLVGVALEGGLQLELLLDAGQPRGDDRRRREVGVHVPSRDPVLQPQRGSVSDEPEGTRPVVPAPLQCGRREGPLDVPLVAVDVRGQQQRQLADVGELTRDEGPAGRREPVLAVTGQDHVPVRAPEAAVDVAGVALALVELGHERERVPVLGRDLLGAVLVHDVVVAGDRCLVVAEGDLVLSEVALPLRRLDGHPAAGHAVPDPAQQRLDAGGPHQRVVDVVEVDRPQLPVAGLPRLLVRVVEDHELQLGADERPEPGLCQPSGLPGQDLSRRRDDRRAVLPQHVGEDHDSPLVPRHPPQRRQVGLHDEVAVPARPGGHGVPVDRGHVDVDREEVVASFRALLERDVEEVAGVQALALQPPLHVGDRHQHGVHAPGRDVGAQLVERQGGVRTCVLRQGSPAPARRPRAPPRCPAPWDR